MTLAFAICSWKQLHPDLCYCCRLFNQLTADAVTWSDTFSKFIALFDNYEVNTRVEEKFSEADRDEIDEFLEAILSTDVCRYLGHFLIRKGWSQKLIH